MIRKTVSLTNLLISFVLVTYLNINPSSGKPNRRRSLLCSAPCTRAIAGSGSGLVMLWGPPNCGVWSVCVELYALREHVTTNIEKVDEWRIYQLPSQFDFAAHSLGSKCYYIITVSLFGRARNTKMTANDGHVCLDGIFFCRSLRFLGWFGLAGW